MSSQYPNDPTHANPRLAAILRIPEAARLGTMEQWPTSKVASLCRAEPEGSDDEDTIVFKGHSQRRIHHSTEWQLRRRGSSDQSTQPTSAPPGRDAQKAENFRKFYRAVVSPTNVRVTAGGRIVPNTRAPPQPEFVWSQEQSFFEHQGGEPTRGVRKVPEPLTFAPASAWRGVATPTTPFSPVHLVMPQVPFQRPGLSAMPQMPQAAPSVGHNGAGSNDENVSGGNTANGGPQGVELSPPQQFDSSRPFYYQGHLCVPVPRDYSIPSNLPVQPISALAARPLAMNPTQPGFQMPVGWASSMGLPPPFMPMPLQAHGQAFNVAPQMGYQLPNISSVFAAQSTRVSGPEMKRLAIASLRQQMGNLDNQLAHVLNMIDADHVNRQKEMVQQQIDTLEAELNTSPPRAPISEMFYPGSMNRANSSSDSQRESGHSQAEHASTDSQKAPPPSVSKETPRSRLSAAAARAPPFKPRSQSQGLAQVFNVQQTEQPRPAGVSESSKPSTFALNGDWGNWTSSPSANKGQVPTQTPAVNPDEATKNNGQSVEYAEQLKLLNDVFPAPSVSEKPELPKLYDGVDWSTGFPNGDVSDWRSPPPTIQRRLNAEGAAQKAAAEASRAARNTHSTGWGSHSNSESPTKALSKPESTKLYDGVDWSTGYPNGDLSDWRSPPPTIQRLRAAQDWSIPEAMRSSARHNDQTAGYGNQSESESPTKAPSNLQSHAKKSEWQHSGVDWSSGYPDGDITDWRSPPPTIQRLIRAQGPYWSKKPEPPVFDPSSAASLRGYPNDSVSDWGSPSSQSKKPNPPSFVKAETVPASLGPASFRIPYLTGYVPTGIEPGEARSSDYVYSRELSDEEKKARALYWGNADRELTRGLPKFDGKDFYPASPQKQGSRPELQRHNSSPLREASTLQDSQGAPSLRRATARVSRQTASSVWGSKNGDSHETQTTNLGSLSSRSYRGADTSASSVQPPEFGTSSKEYPSELASNPTALSSSGDKAKTRTKPVKSQTKMGSTFLHGMLSPTLNYGLAASATPLSGTMSSATAQGYLPQYPGAAAASLAPTIAGYSNSQRSSSPKFNDKLYRQPGETVSLDQTSQYASSSENLPFGARMVSASHDATPSQGMSASESLRQVSNRPTRITPRRVRTPTDAELIREAMANDDW